MLLLLLSIKAADLTSRPFIVPEPNEMQVDDGFFVLTKETTISYDKTAGNLSFIANLTKTWINGATGFELTLSDSPLPHGITFKIANQEMTEEEYLLKVNAESATISAKSYNGWLYGFTSLLQLFPPEIYNLKPEVECAMVETTECRKYEWNQSTTIEWKAQAVTIHDTPRFGYRGIMLDASRHFFSLDVIKRLLRIMTLHKLNNFQIHLTDDPGNRFESKKFPKFQEIGSVRKESPKPWSSGQGDGKQYGPFFYTQDQLRDLVRYASQLGINIVPEFEMPGHSLGGLAPYPEFSCRQQPLEVSCRWGGSADVYCPGNDDTIKHIEEVLLEIIDIFPSKFIHIGGDECQHVRWQSCTKCQARIKNEGLKNVGELQGWFISHFADFLEPHGRRIVGWGEILSEKLSKSAVIMTWQGIMAAVEATKKGYSVLDDANRHFYYNYKQFPENDIYEYNSPLDFVPYWYSYQKDPYYMIEKENRHLILGVQASAWSEFIWGDEPDLHYKLFPRTTALSEVGWTQVVHKNWYRHITGQVRAHRKRMAYMGVMSAPLMLRQEPKWNKDMISTEWKTVSFNLTGAINRGDCSYMAGFIKTGGANNLKVKNVKILVNGEQWARDVHEGIASFLPNYSAFYEWDFTKGTPANAKVELVADICGDKGVDSEGDLVVFATTSKSPYPTP